MTGMLFLLWSAGCISTKHEVEVKPIEVKPMHITVDVNLKIQNELKKEFKEKEQVMGQISDDEAAAALAKYLQSKN